MTWVRILKILVIILDFSRIFDTYLSSDFSWLQQNRLKCVQIQSKILKLCLFYSKSSISIKKVWNLEILPKSIKNDKVHWLFWLILTLTIDFEHFQSFNWHFNRKWINIHWKLIKNWSKYNKMDQNPSI